MASVVRWARLRGPLVVTLDVPDHVLDIGGGFAEPTETVEYRQAATDK